ncbi:hypothetical protein M0811_08225 [Anaeramoeba ignava]|uniref:Uncharacterized protein n=1 Tax=Anaeramoeba ignava TaxID=1746090 RepID=A0A9Q0LJB3_ANAIG|nr:hypothetical protein M0811_08225 [Anaeramoeba ignava]
MTEWLSFTHEMVENVLGESFISRQNQLKQTKIGLGSPDLCHLIKSSSSNPKNDPASLVGFYHHVIGVDTSSLAGIASYFGRLINSQKNSKFFQKNWTILSGTYCSYNAFSKIDFHIHFILPGKFYFDFFDSDGKKINLQKNLDFFFFDNQANLFFRKYPSLNQNQNQNKNQNENQNQNQNKNQNINQNQNKNQNQNQKSK